MIRETRMFDKVFHKALMLASGMLVVVAPLHAADQTDAGVAATEPASSQSPSGGDAGETSDLGKVVVHSTRPTLKPLQEQQDVPKSVSVVSGAELENLDALNVTDILKRIGNVQWNYGNPKTGSLSIRGVSAGSTEQIDPSLGVVVDGVPYAYTALASALDYVDVASVEVARGPQGSTGGKNTSMGTITVTSNEPSFTPEAHGSLIIGQDNAVVNQAAVGGPAIDDLLAWRATFYRNEQQGSYNNSYADNQNRLSWQNSDRTFGRLQFLLTPTDDLSVLVSTYSKPKGIEFVNGLSVKLQQPAFYADGKPTYIANGLPGATNTIQNKLTRSYFTAENLFSYQDYLAQPIAEDDDKGIQNASNGTFARVRWNLGGQTLQSTTAYEYNFFQASNDDGTPFNVTTDGGLYTHYEQKSEELSLTSKPGGWLDYRTGLFYIQTSSDANTRNRYGADAGAYNANAAQYTTLDANASGVELLVNSLDRVYTTSTVYTSNKSAAAFGQLDWHLAQPLTLTTGLRFTREDRQTSANKLVADDGFGAALDPAAYGGFASNASTGVLVAGANSTAQLNLADALANQYFGAAITAVPGEAYASLTAAQLKQVASAKALRNSIAYTTGLYDTLTAEPYKGTLTTGNISLSYKFDADRTGYISWQHGAKAGISQIVTIRGLPTSLLAAPESSNAYELGLKGNYFNHSLLVNADVFVDDLRNYQQSVGIYDAVLSAQNGTATYDTVTGNAPLVRIGGVEVDAAYTGIRRLTLRFAGAYNDAFYKDDIQLAQPVERGDSTSSTYDAKGQALGNAPHFTGNLSGEYTVPVFADKVFHTNINYHYTSRFHSDAANSIYAVVDGYGLTDFGIGIGRQDRRFDVNLLVKNLFNTSYRFSQTWTSYVPGLPRWYGVAVTADVY